MARYPLKNRQYNLKKRYDMTMEDYDGLHEEQEGMCAICGAMEGGTTRSRKLHVDHNHTTGDVRGLLCNECNTGLGKFKDDTAILKNAITYLQEN